jgi:hypothetical protein
MNDDMIIARIGDFEIKHGKRGDCSYCPIALAIAKALPLGTLHGPYWQQIKVFDNTNIEIRGRRYVTSFEATKWMTDFDDMKEVKPVEFILIPHEREDEYEF